MPDTMSFPKTLDEFMEQYKITVTLPYVRKKKAYTLYQVWQDVDRKETR